jgi:hypothetical protein
MGGRDPEGPLLRTTIVLAFALLWSASPLLADPVLLRNGSFEELSLIEGSPDRDRGAGQWTLDGSRMPTHWRPNSVYPGHLAITGDGAFHGKRCMTITAGKARDAQIYQPLADLRPGRWYHLSVRVKGGPASLLVYEYRKDRPAPVAKTLSSDTAPKNAWRRINGFYCPEGEDFASASIVLFVPKGASATFDDATAAETGATRPPDGAPFKFGNSAAKLVIGRRGRLLSLMDRKGRELAEPTSTTTVLSAVRNGIRYPVNGIASSGSDLAVSFVDPSIKVRLGIRKRKRCFTFEVKHAEPDDLESLELTFPVSPLATRSTAANGTWDERTGLCHRSVTPNGRCRLVPRGRAVCPTVTWYQRHGIAGGQSALVATSRPDFLRAIEEMEEATGLPSPKLPDRWGGEGRPKRRWARTSPTVARSYLFVTSYAPGDVDFLIDAAKAGGFDLILFLDGIWKNSAGHYAVREDRFPGGIEGLKEVGEKIHAAGLGFGLHFVGATVSENDAYVTPKPDPRLLGLPCPDLAEKIGKDATTMTLAGPPAHASLLSRPPSRFPGLWLQVGGEIVSFKKFEAGPPARFTGLKRGALGTTASSHRKGTAVRSLPMAYRCFLVDPDSDIVPELGKSLSSLVNGAGVDMVYFDAIGTIDAASGIDTWYYLNRLVPALCAGFKRDVLVQTGMGLGREMLWHLVPRSASADGHGDLKGYLDRRLPAVRSIRRQLSAADVGWYVLGPGTDRDQLEYVAARCLALDASISVQANRHVLTQHPRAREIMEMLGRYEWCRRTGGLPAAARKALVEPRRDFRLLEAEPDQYRMFVAEYEPVRVVTALDGKANVIAVTNPRKEPVRLEVEISREKQIATPADAAAPDAFTVADFADLTLYDADAENRYPDCLTETEGVLTKGGMARWEVAAGLTRGPKEGSITLTARNTGPGAGWMARGRRFDPPRDLSEAEAFAVRVRGDRHGQVLTIRFVDRAGAHRNWHIPIGFTGWRFRTFERPTSPGFDWKAVEYLVIRVTRIPRETATAVSLGPVKAMTWVSGSFRLRGLSITAAGKTFAIKAPLGPGRALTIDALGRATMWPGGMAPGERLSIEGLPITIPTGRHLVRLNVADPEAWPGDLLLRVSRQWEER